MTISELEHLRMNLPELNRHNRWWSCLGKPENKLYADEWCGETFINVEKTNDFSLWMRSVIVRIIEAAKSVKM